MAFAPSYDVKIRIMEAARIGLAMRNALLGAVAGLVLAGASPGFAISYLTRTEPILFTDGRSGRMLRLHGEGVFSGDPERIIVLDSDGRLVARSPRGGPMSFICEKRTCSGYDHGRDQVLEVDPTGFRSGPVISGEGNDLDQLEESESGAEHWGFKPRDAGYLEWLSGEYSFLRERFWLLVPLSVPGGALTLATLLILFAFASRAKSDAMVLARVAAGVSGFAAGGAGLLIAILLLVAIPMSGFALLVGMSLGAVCTTLAVFGGRLMLRRVSLRYHQSRPA